MKKGIFLLVLAVVVALGSMFLTCRFYHHGSSVEWLRSEFRLNDEQMRQVTLLHDSYQAACDDMCQRIAAADTRLQTALKSGTSATPEVIAAITETDRVRTECRVAMARHFYQTAELMPADRRARYLEKVLPLVLHSRAAHRP